jgi:hypothetical protein
MGRPPMRVGSSEAPMIAIERGLISGSSEEKSMLIPFPPRAPTVRSVGWARSSEAESPET